MGAEVIRNVRVVCAWCGLVIHSGDLRDGVSHGVCWGCGVEQLEAFGITSGLHVSAEVRYATDEWVDIGGEG